MATTQDVCPECGKAAGLPIVWGKLTEETAAKIERGEAIPAVATFLAGRCAAP